MIFRYRKEIKIKYRYELNSNLILNWTCETIHIVNIIFPKIIENIEYT